MAKRICLMLLTLLIAGCVAVEENANPHNQTVKPKHSATQSELQLYQGAWDDSVQSAADISTSTKAALQADQALARGDKNKAAAFYARAIELDKKNVNAGYKLAVLHEDAGNYGQAEQLYRYLLKQSPRHTGILEGLGLILLEQNNLKEARRLLVKSVAIFETQNTRENNLQNHIPIKAFNGLGLIADRNGDYQQAQAYYRQGLSLNPDSASMMNNLAYSYFLAGDWKKAKALLYQVLQIQPHYPRAVYNLALVNVRDRRFNKAVELLEQFMEPYEASNDVGYLAMMVGDNVAAAELFQQAIDLAPSYYETAWKNMDKLKQLSGISKTEIKQ
ncbi:MAG: tetratricopeptide repeat protein [Endozoicomonas sp. (ex Botrylloides leachii)]|nr:tetratricopeptide repeat protein [Endozoicomonas sp. (ex Botrylloides leachii)]